MNAEQKFDKTYTGLVKGIAVIILLIHHLTYTAYQVPLVSFKDLVTVLTKVCVPIFTILSGYGMTKSYKKKDVSDFKFVINHIKKVLINYWYIYIPMFILSFFLHIEGTPIEIYGLGIIGIKNGLMDFLGLKTLFNTPTLNTSWWYMEIVLIYYAIFPFLYKCIKKKTIITLTISVIPCIVTSITHYNNTDREIFYLFAFLIGILFAEKDYLDNIIMLCNRNKIFFAIMSIFLIFFFGIQATQISLIANTFFAIAIIMFGILLKCFNLKLNKFLEILGKNSMNIFLIHSFIYYYFIISRDIIYSMPNVFIRYIILLSSSLILSIKIEKSKVTINRLRNTITREEN